MREGVTGGYVLRGVVGEVGIERGKEEVISRRY